MEPQPVAEESEAFEPQAYYEEEAVEEEEPPAPFVPGIPQFIAALSSKKVTNRDRALAQLRVLSAEKDNQIKIAEAGGISPLVKLLSVVEAQERAAAVLMNLAFTASNQGPVAEAGAIPPLVDLLSSKATMAQRHAAGALKNLCQKHPGNRAKVMAAGAVEPLIKLLSSGSEDVQQRAAGAIKNLAANSPDNRKAICGAGAIPPLTELLRSKNNRVAEQAAGAIRNLVHDNLGGVEACESAGTIPLLKALLKCKSAEVRVQAAAALKNINALRAALVEDSEALIYDTEALMADADGGEAYVTQYLLESARQLEGDFVPKATVGCLNNWFSPINTSSFYVLGSPDRMCSIAWTTSHTFKKVESTSYMSGGFGGSFKCDHDVHERVSTQEWTQVSLHQVKRPSGWSKSGSVDRITTCDFKAEGIVPTEVDAKASSYRADGKMLYVADGKALLGFDVSGGACKLAWKMPMAHTANITTIHSTSRGKVLVTGAANGTVKLWTGFEDNGLPSHHTTVTSSSEHEQPVLAAAVGNGGGKGKRLVYVAFGEKGSGWNTREGYLTSFEVDVDSGSVKELRTSRVGFKTAASLVAVGDLVVVGGGGKVQALHAPMLEYFSTLCTASEPEVEFDEYKWVARQRYEGRHKAELIKPEALDAPPVAVAPSGRRIVVGNGKGVKVFDVSSGFPVECPDLLKEVEHASDIDGITIAPSVLPGEDDQPPTMVMLTRSREIQVKVKHSYDTDVHHDTGNVYATAERNFVDLLTHGVQQLWQVQL